MLLELLWAKKAKVYADSQLVIYQMTEEFKCISSVSQEFSKKAQELSKQCKKITFIHILKEENRISYQLSRIASAREEIASQNEDIILQKTILDPLNETDKEISKSILEVYIVSILREDEDWRNEIIHYLQNPTGTKVSNRVKMAATKFCMQFDELHRKDPK